MKIPNRTTQRLLKVMSQKNLTPEEAMTSLLIGEQYLSDNEISPMVDYLQMSATTAKMSKLVKRVNAKAVFEKPKIIIAQRQSENYYDIVNAAMSKYNDPEIVTDIEIYGDVDLQGINILDKKDADVIAIYNLNVFGDYKPAIMATIENLIAKGMTLFIAKTGQEIRKAKDLKIVSAYYNPEHSE